MVIEKRDDTLWADIFWDDLSAEAQDELLRLMGENGNFDVFPIASINVSTEELTMDTELRETLIGKAADIYEDSVIPYDDLDLENHPGNDYTVQDALSAAAKELGIENFEDEYYGEYEDLLEKLILKLGI